MKKILCLILSLIMLSGLAACGNRSISSDPNAPESGYAEWIYCARSGDLDTADPYGGTSSQTEWFTNMTFDTLVYNNPETGTIDPELATSWEGNADNTEWIFHLAKGVKFHNGDSFTAEDVKFTFEYAANLDGATNVVKTFTAGSYAEKVEVVDEYTIKFVLKQPMPDFPSYMEMKVYSKNAIETLGHAEGSVIGTGPYYYDKELTVSGQMFVATRNDNYWRNQDSYKSKHIACKLYGDENAIAAALQAGEIDFTVNGGDQNFSLLNDDPAITCEVKTGCESYYLGFNYASKACDMNDPEIRRAICQCIDKNAICEMGFEGLGDPSYNFCAPSGLGHSSEVKGIEYDLEAGKATLAAKGVKKLTLIYYSPKIAEVIQACLKQAGVTVDLHQMDGTNWTTVKAAQDGYDMFIDYCSYRGALLYNYNRFLYRGGSSNVFGYASEEYEKLQDKISEQTSWEDMVKQFGVLQQWVADECPIVPLAYHNRYIAKLEGVSGGYLGGSDNACDWSTIYKIQK